MIIYLYFYPKITIYANFACFFAQTLLHTQSSTAWKVEKHAFQGLESPLPCSNTESVRIFRNDPYGMMEKGRCHFSRCDKLLVFAAERNMMFRQKGHVQPCCFIVETMEIFFGEQKHVPQNITSFISSIQIQNSNHILFMMLYSSNSL